MRGADDRGRARRTLTAALTVGGAGAATALAWFAVASPDAVSAPRVARRPTAPAAGALSSRPRPLAARGGATMVCQALPDGTYVLVRVTPTRLVDYRRNPANLIPAPAGGCPAQVAAAAPAVTTSTAAAPAPAPAPATTTTAASARPPARTATQAAVAPRHATRVSTMPAVRPATASSPAVPAPRPYTGSLPAHLASLPNTGFPAFGPLLGGLALLLLGGGLRLRASAPARRR